MIQPEDKLIQLTLTGKYCQVTCKLIREVGQHQFWDAKCRFSQVGSNEGTDEEKIAFFISYLPDISLLEGGSNLHYGIIQNWLIIKEKMLEIAYCLLSNKSQANDVLLYMLHHKIIDEWSYQYRWLEAYLYKNIYNLITCNQGNLLINSLKNSWSYPFESTLELICQVIREDIEGEFGLYLLPQYQYKANDIKEISKLKRKEHRDELSPAERAKLWALIDQHTIKNIWLARLIREANRLAEEGCSEISKFLKIHSTILYEINRLQIESHCNPALKSHRVASHYCENGVICYGVKPKWKA